MKRKLLILRKKLCAVGLAAAAVAGGIAVPMAINVVTADETQAAVTINASRIRDYFNSQVNQKKLSGLCLKFVDDGYAALGFSNTRVNSAKIMMDKYTLNTSKTPPVGAYVFFYSSNVSPYGHVGVWVGDGVVATQGKSGQNLPIAKKSIDQWAADYGAYRGWVIPSGLTVNNDINPQPILNNYWPLADGYYTIKTDVGNKFLNVAGMGTADRTNVQIWDAFGAHSGQIFKVGKNSMGTGYYIQNLNSGKLIDTVVTRKGQGTNGDNVVQYHDDSSNAQQHKLEDAGNGLYYIKNLYNIYLDVSGGKDANGTNVQTWQKGNVPAQKWKFTRVSGKNLANIADGDYMIYSKVGNKVLNAAGNGTGNGTNLQLWDPGDYTGNVFTVQKDGRFVTKIKNKAANRMVDSQGGKNAPENAQLWDYNNGYGQNWYIEDAGDGYVYIRNLWGYYLDVDNGNNSNGTNVQTWSYNGTDAQKWKFVKYDKIAVTGISLNSYSASLTEGGNYSLSATVTPGNASNRNVSWSSSNTNVATVDSSGMVKAVKAGTATITARTEDGGKTASCTVTVKPKTIDISSTNFPDTNFRKFISDAIDSNKDGKLSSDEIEKTKVIHCENKKISSLAGIEYFTNLESLYCENNTLTKLDVSKNKKLVWLRCVNNKLSTLDVSQNASLTSLECSNNILTNLKLGNSITTLACSNNKLETLSVSGLRYLHDLSCSNNNIYELDLTNNSDLYSLYCSNNKFVALNLRNNKQIEYYDYSGQTRTLKSADGYIPPEGDRFSVEWDYVSNVKGAKRIDNIWYEIEKGKNIVTYDYATGLSKPMSVKLQFEDLKVSDTRTGVYKINNQWTYLKSGKVQTSFSGLIYGNNQWYYMNKGVQDKKYTGLTQYNGGWWYIKNGTIDKSFTGIVDYNKNSWYVRNGKVDKSYTGLAYVNNTWWYVNKGYVGKSYRGLVYHNKQWWYVNNGKLDKSFNSLYYYNNKWWYIKNGTIDKSFKGLFKYNGNLWYVINGAVDKTFNGKVLYQGKTLIIKNGWGGKV